MLQAFLELDRFRIILFDDLRELERKRRGRVSEVYTLGSYSSFETMVAYYETLQTK